MTKINQNTNIFFQNGMENNYQQAKESANLLKKLTNNKEIGIIANKTGEKLFGLPIDDIKEYLPNSLTLKDALNAEIYQQIAENTPKNKKSLIITHSAGNEDAIKAAKALKLNNINLNNKIDIISVGSPKSNKTLKQHLEPVGINIKKSYNNPLDPVTHPKTWMAGTATLLIAGTVYGATTGAAMSTVGGGLEAYFTGLIGGGIGGGIGYTNLKIQHPFQSYLNKNFKDLSTDIKDWSKMNPVEK